MGRDPEPVGVTSDHAVPRRRDADDLEARRIGALADDGLHREVKIRLLARVAIGPAIVAAGVFMARHLRR